LTLRAYVGAQRFLEDSLGGKDWMAYPLHLPGGTTGIVELFRVALSLGDGLARETALRRIAEMPANASWEALERLAVKGGQDSVDLPPAEQQTYQTLLRSCATMALYSITLTLARLRVAGHSEGVDWDQVPGSTLDKEEPWMVEAAAADMGGVAKRVPQALKFLTRSPASFPSQIPDILDRAGILEKKEGSVVRHKYTLHKQTPYGSLADNLIR
jgi:hypothetical protein